MNELINYLLQFGNLNTQQIELIKQKAKPLFLKKEEYSTEAGKVPKHVVFTKEGILRVCYYDNQGNEFTRYFIDEGHLAVDIKNFEANTESSEYVQAVTDCELIAFSRTDWFSLSRTILEWDSIVNQIIKKGLIEKLERKAPLVEKDATSRYLTFLEQYPQVANRIPLSYLASYLGITQSTLSRIRKNIR